MKWTDIDLERRVLRIREGKSDASRRMLPLPEILVRVLQEHQREQEAERRIRGDEWHEHGLIFPSTVGTPLIGRNLVRHFKDMLARAGLPETIRFHDLRHSCASFLVAQGVHMRVVMEVLGHSRIAITADTYSHVVDSTMRDAIDRLENILDT